MPFLHRFFARFLVIATSFVSSSLLWSQTEVSGLVSGAWTVSNSPYLVTSDAIIAETETLRIDPGVIVMFKDADDDLVIQGTLIAAGSSGSPIRFTSNDPSPAPGQWGQITFNDSSNDATTHMSHCIIEFGGGFRNQQIEIVSSSPTLRNLTVRSGRTNGIGVVSGNPSLTEITFIQNADYAMTIDVHSFPSLSGSSAEANGHDTIARHGGTLSGSGTWVRDALPYTILNDIVVPAEQSLSIEPGTTVQFRDADDDLFVDGTLVANGTVSAPILFTSNEEDLAPGQWGAIILRDSEGKSKTELRHCIIEAGGGFRNEQIDITTASPTLSHLLIRQGRVHGIKITDGDPIIDSCTFEDNIQYAAVADVFSYPRFSNSTANRNGHNAIGRSGGTAIDSGTWVNDNIPYTIIDDIIVKEGVTLIIESGTTVQFQDVDADLVFDGRLHAVATESSPIVFTSNDEDKVPGQWGAVIIRNQGEAEASIVDGCVFEFGGGFRTEMLLIDRASPTINHSIFRSGRVHGATLSTASPSISNTRFIENAQFAMSMDVHSFPVLGDNTASDNGSNSIGIKGGTVIANGTWIANPVPFTIVNDILIAETAEITLTPGSTIQFANTDDDLTVDGALIAQGTSERPILFTSDKPEKTAGQWGSIAVREPADDARTVFEHCVIEYGGGFRTESLRLVNASPRITNTQINHSRVRGLSLVNSQSQINQSLFSHNTDYAIVIDTKSFPTFSEIAASDNGADAVGILGGTIDQSNSWHHSPIPYTVINDVSVAPNATLSIEPGTIVQFQDADDDLRIEGSLLAVSDDAITRPIVFTSNESEKLPGQWGHVSITGSEEAASMSSRLVGCVFEAGGGFQTQILLINQAVAEIRSSQFRLSRVDGMNIKRASPTLTDNHFESNNAYALKMDTASFPINSFNSGSNNAANAIGIIGGTVEQSGTWRRDTLPITLINDVVIAPNNRLTIQPGTLIQFQDADDDLLINGTLVANGTSALPIRFSSDNAEKEPGQWGALLFQDPSNDQESSMTFANVEYGGGFRNGSIELDSASPTLTAIQIQFARADGLFSSSSRSVILKATFRENARDGIRARSGSTLRINPQDQRFSF